MTPFWSQLVLRAKPQTIEQKFSGSLVGLQAFNSFLDGENANIL